MGRKTQIRVGDVMVDVTDEDFEIVTEPWNEYRLLDGGRVRVKTTIHKIYRVLDANGKQKISPDGDPEVLVRHNAQIVATEE